MILRWIPNVFLWILAEYKIARFDRSIIHLSIPTVPSNSLCIVINAQTTTGIILLLVFPQSFHLFCLVLIIFNLLTSLGIHSSILRCGMVFSMAILIEDIASTVNFCLFVKSQQGPRSDRTLHNIYVVSSSADFCNTPRLQGICKTHNCFFKVSGYWTQCSDGNGDKLVWCS